MTMTTRIAIDEALLAAGLKWLYETGQPDGAIIQHHGTSRASADRARLYGFTSSGAADLPVISVTVLGWEYDPVTRDPFPLLDSGEMAAVAGVITRLGGKIRETWNGDGCITGSFGLAVPAHPSLVAAVERYRAMCPAHKTVFCGNSDWTERHGEQCRWFADGNALIAQLT